MPQLPSKQQWTEEDHKKFAELALGIESPLKHFGEAMQANNLLLKSIFDPAINETMRSIALGFESPLRQLGQSIGKMMSDLAIEQLRESFRSLSRFTYPFDVIDGEYVQSEDDSQVSASTETALIPQQSYVPVPVAPPSQRAKMGLKEVPGGFKYKGRIIKKVSHKNAEGRFLSLLLKSSDCFAKDEEIYEKLHLNVGRSFSWILRNLKNKFKKANFLRVEIERRWDPDGYVIVGVNYIN